MENVNAGGGYSSIEEYIEAEGITDDRPPFASWMRRADEERRRKFRAKYCPINKFTPCRFDDCALFDNDKAGLPWWGVCRLGRWPIEE